MARHVAFCWSISFIVCGLYIIISILLTESHWIKKHIHVLINSINTYATFHLKLCIYFYNQHFFLEYVLMSFFYTFYCSSNIISIIFCFSAQSPFQRFTQRPATKVHTCSMYMFRVYTNGQCSLLRKFHKKFTN